MYSLLWLMALSSLSAHKLHRLPELSEISYQTYYLEDFCETIDNIDCFSPAHEVYLNSTGTASGLIIRGFRESKPTIDHNLKCCITVRTVETNRINVQMDKIYFKQRNNAVGDKCDSFLEFHGLGRKLGHICDAIGEHSFRTPQQVLEVVYNLTPQSSPEFQKIKVIATSSGSVNTLGMTCNPKMNEYTCGNGACIWSGFLCDSFNNCGDWSDEIHCYWRLDESLEAFAVGCTLLIIVLGCTMYCCCYRKHGAPVQSKTYTLVSSLPRKPQTETNIYPHLSYQNGRNASYHHSLPPQLTPPPPYAESQNFSETLKEQTTYGSTK